MSASRSFIDVLVGKLTAYVDASSRPAPSIQTPWWIATLDAVPASARTASRVYTGHAAYDTAETRDPAREAPTGAAPSAARLSARPWFEAIRQEAPVTEPAATSEAALPARTPAELMAIELLRRLGAFDVHARSSDADLRSAWRRLLRDCHPDVHPHLREADRIVQSARLRALIRARDILDPRPSTRPVAA